MTCKLIPGGIVCGVFADKDDTWAPDKFRGRRYTMAEITDAQKRMKRRYHCDMTEEEAVWFLRDQHEAGWRERATPPCP